MTRAAGLLDLTPEETKARVVASGGKPFHGKIVREQVLEKGVLDYGEMTALSVPLRERLAAELPILTTREEQRLESPDGTIKLLLALGDAGTIETVYIPSHRPERGATLCISTQIGCPVGCPFCASGLLGLERNLRAGEIVEQFVRGKALGPVSRAVVMGIGEPLLNADNLFRALRVVRGEIGIGARKITVSTVGFPERVHRAADADPPFQLAISLHTPDDEQRDHLVPAMAGVPIDDVLAAGDYWFAKTGREITYEYVLLAGENDSIDHAGRLAERIAGRRATVNLIPFNPVAEGPWRRPRPEDVQAFQERLTQSGVVATVRWSRGLDAQAACGQLRIQARSA